MHAVVDAIHVQVAQRGPHVLGAALLPRVRHALEPQLPGCRKYVLVQRGRPPHLCAVQAHPQYVFLVGQRLCVDVWVGVRVWVRVWVCVCVDVWVCVF